MRSPTTRSIHAPVEQSSNITQLSAYEMNIEAANAIWPDTVPIVNPADAWTALVTVGDKTIPAPTHLFGTVVNIIPYSNDDNVQDASGTILKYGDSEVAKVFKRLKDQDIELALDEAAKEFLIEKGYNPDYGARPLRRAIGNYIEDPLSEMLLSGELHGLNTVFVTHNKDEDKLSFRAELVETKDEDAPSEPETQAQST